MWFAAELADSSAVPARIETFMSSPAATPGRPASRRRIVVEGFQTRFVLGQLAWLGAFLVVFLALLFGPLIRPMFREGATTAQLEAANQFLALHRVLWPALAAFLLGLAFVYVRMAHRVAGPIYRFKSVFAEVAGGRLTSRVRLRQGDYLMQEAAALDGMIQSIRERVVDARSAAEIAARAAAAAQQAAAQGRTVPASDLQAISDAATAAANRLQSFVTSDGKDALQETGCKTPK